MWLFKTVIAHDFFIFILGTFGMNFFLQLHKEIKRCNPYTFAAICEISAFIWVSFLSNSI